MPVLKEQLLELHKEEHIVQARQAVRHWAEELKFNLVDQTKLVTAASELARNTIIYGGGGRMRMQAVTEGVRTGLRLSFEDEGPGIPDIELALQDGFTTGNGLGLGLGGTRRLVNQFEVQSTPGKGTCVTIARWK